MKTASLYTSDWSGIAPLSELMKSTVRFHMPASRSESTMPPTASSSVIMHAAKTRRAWFGTSASAALCAPSNTESGAATGPWQLFGAK